jgi:hypothetical protein
MAIRNLYRGVLTAIAIVLVCASSAMPRAAAAPTITSFSPTSGPIGTKVTITGSGLYGATIEFNGFGATTVSASPDGTHAVVAVPDEATSGPITVMSQTGTAQAPASFTITNSRRGAVQPPMAALKPQIIGFTPLRGRIGASVTVTGRQFGGALVVRLGGSKATFRVPSTTKIVLTVPPRAKSGKISIATRFGAAVSTARFTVIPSFQG